MTFVEKVNITYGLLEQIFPAEKFRSSHTSGRSFIISAHTHFHDHGKKKIPPIGMVVDFLREGLTDKGFVEGVNFEIGAIEDEEFIFPIVNDAEPLPHFRSRAWKIGVFFPIQIQMGPPAIIQLCEDALHTGEWRIGIRCRKKCESTMYKVGQEVYPSRVNPFTTKYRWFFITSYRSSGLGAFRLLRMGPEDTDASLTSTGVIYEIEADVDYTTNRPKEKKRC